MEKKKNGKLINKLVAILASVIVILNLIEITIVIESTKKAIRETSVVQQTEFTGMYSHAIAHEMETYFESLSFYAKSEVAETGSSEEITDWLRSKEGYRPDHFDYVGWVDVTGTMMTDINTSTTIKDRDYFQSVMQGGKDFYIDDPVLSKTTGKYSIHVCRAVNVNGRKKGFFCGVVSLDELEDLFNGIDLGKTGRSILISSTGNTMISSREDAQLNPDVEILHGRINGTEGAFEYVDSLKKKGFCFFEEIEHTPWRLAITYEASDLLSTSTHVGRFMTVGGVLLAFLILATIAGLIISSLKPLNIVEKNILDIASGEADLTKRINISQNSEIGRVVDGFNLFTKKLQDIVTSLKESKNDLYGAGQELTESTSDTSSSIIEIISNIESMERFIGNQTDSVNQTAGAVNEIASNIESLSRMIEGQTNAVTHASAAVEQMIGNINSVNNSVGKMAYEFNKLEEKANSGVEKQEDVNVKIQIIENESKALQEANSVISSIAAQTNLLAMNAAIEAAHAGEAGKGFSVVADEIRKLSETSSSQSRTIGEQLQKITASISDMILASQAAGASFVEVSTGINNTNNLVQEIKSAMQEQGEGSKQISIVLNNMNDSSNEVKSSSLEMSEGNKTILDEIKHLQDATLSMKEGMNEMSVGAKKINETGAALSALSHKMEDSINRIGEQIDQFKV